jgi:hypothetical protein
MRRRRPYTPVTAPVAPSFSPYAGQSTQLQDPTPRMALSAPVRAPKRRRAGGRTVLVGDSLGVGTAPYLHAKANARVGRPSREGVRVLRSMKRRYGRVIFDLGTNDPSAHELARNVRKADRISGDATVYVPFVHGPKARQKNRAIRRLARNRRDVRAVRWNAPRGPDRIHATPQGYRRRARQIRRVLGER